MAIQEKRIEEWLVELASASATPGGGSAAALVGAMGAALLSMVCRLTIGKARFADVEDELQGVLAEAEALRDQLTGLADADVQAFDQVMAAYRLPKETEEGRVARQVAIQAGLRQATEIPLQTVTACASVLGLVAQVIGRINLSALSDGGAAALLAEAGLRAAQLNVSINLAAIQDEDFVRDRQQAMNRIVPGADQAREAVMAYVLAHE